MQLGLILYLVLIQSTLAQKYLLNYIYSNQNCAGNPSSVIAANANYCYNDADLCLLTATGDQNNSDNRNFCNSLRSSGSFTKFICQGNSFLELKYSDATCLSQTESMDNRETSEALNTCKALVLSKSTKVFCSDFRSPTLSANSTTSSNSNRSVLATSSIQSSTTVTTMTNYVLQPSNIPEAKSTGFTAPISILIVFGFLSIHFI